MPTWSMIDKHGDEAGIYQDNGVLLSAVRWQSRLAVGEALDVQLYLYSPGLVFPTDPYACEALLTGGGWGKEVTAVAISHPANDTLTERTYCVEKSGFNGPSYKPLDVPMPEEPGEYEIRVLFMAGGPDSTTPQFPDQTFGDWHLPSELKLPVTVTEEATSGCSANTDCPEGQVCEGGECVPADGTGQACSETGDCPDGMVCREGRCVVPEGGDGSADIPVVPLALAGGAAFLISRKRRDQ